MFNNDFFKLNIRKFYVSGNAKNHIADRQSQNI